MKETDTRKRCPRCHRVAEPAADGTCPRCDRRSRPPKWEDYTWSQPIQPEEENFGRCLHCEAPVRICLGDRISAPSRGSTVFVGLLSGLAICAWAAISGEYRMLFGGAWICAISLIHWPLRRLYLSCDGEKIRKSIVVLCRECGFVRIGGRDDPAAVRPFLRARSTLGRLYGWTLAVALFFLSTWLVGLFSGKAVGMTAPLIAGGAGVGWVLVWQYRLVFCPPRLRDLLRRGRTPDS